ncbi:metallophosphoesterase [Paenibacillus sp. NAIST15-1]|uniref:metallophosphoesterase n=1 Tax=Paenibacillus sp. NAIST15-1 TaxID=1605994 RepID=UPI00086E78EC|nr:metallophosphoesterase [Paenibacillus sp. NAIST15-1]GAV10957.1 acid phosphatase/fibronectin domain protein [Paenibacillus sp. NAIST15-1]
MSTHMQPTLVFPVISDIHIDPSGEGSVAKFERAMLQLNARAPHQDAFVIVGDLTNNGLEEEYDRNLEVFRKHKLPGATPLITIGNHDYWNGLPIEEAQARFLAKTEMPSLYFHQVIKGYHFIVMATEDKVTSGYFSLDQIAWLREQLQVAAADSAERPIFVFLHQHLKDTVYGSEDWGIQDNIEPLMEALRPYPQVITFSGHSHYPLQDPRSIHQEDFTSVGTASLSYMEVEHGKLQGNLPLGFEKFSQGLLVEVYEDRVAIHRLDFEYDRQIGDAWIVSLPASTSTFTYTIHRDTEEPCFPDHAQLHVEEECTTSHSIVIVFDQASDNELVHAYNVTVENRSDVEEIVHYAAFSESYKYPVPEQLRLEIPGLKPDCEYSIAVQAIDAFGNGSKRVLQGSCRTRPVEVLKVEN